MAHPKPVRDLEDPIRRAYRQAQERIDLELERLATQPERWRRTQRLRGMRNRILATMDELDDRAARWASQSLPRVYALGASTGVAQATGGDLVWSQIHQEAVARLATGLFDDLLAASQQVRASTKQLIRRVARDTALQKAIEGRTAKQAGREMSRILEHHRVYAVRYANGARHGIGEYGQMAIRSTTAVAYNEGTIRGAEGVGVRWFECLDGPGCGWTAHDDGEEANGKIVDRDEALSYPISHPNCRRAFGARPDLLARV